MVLSKVTVRNGHLEKIMPLIEENAKHGTELKGCLEGYITRGVENPNEVVIYSKWQSQEAYEEAKKTLKKEPRTKRLMFQFLPHVSNYETTVYEILQVNL